MCIHECGVVKRITTRWLTIITINKKKGLLRRQSAQCSLRIWTANGNVFKVSPLDKGFFLSLCWEREIKELKFVFFFSPFIIALFFFTLCVLCVYKSSCNIVTDMPSLANVQMVLRFFWLFIGFFFFCCFRFSFFFFFPNDEKKKRRACVVVVNMYLYMLSAHSCIWPKPTLLPKHVKHSKNCPLPKYNKRSSRSHGSLLEEKRRSSINGRINEEVHGRGGHRKMANLCASRSVKVIKDRERDAK